MLRKNPDGQNCSTCGNCKHTPLPQDVRGQLECRAQPPQMFAMPIATPQGPQFVPASSWPVVKPDEWCRGWVAGPVVLPANH